MNVKDALLQARPLIADREHWTFGSHAETAEGVTVDFDDPEAYCFCADGALARVTGVSSDWSETPLYQEAAQTLRRAAIHMFPAANGYVGVNDGGIGIPPDLANERERYDAQHANILRVFDLALTL